MAEVESRLESLESAVTKLQRSSARSGAPSRTRQPQLQLSVEPEPELEPKLLVSHDDDWSDEEEAQDIGKEHGALVCAFSRQFPR